MRKVKNETNGLNNWKFNKNIILDKIFNNCPCSNKDTINNTKIKYLKIKVTILSFYF